jgi:hypothetical protein
VNDRDKIFGVGVDQLHLTITECGSNLPIVEEHPGNMPGVSSFNLEGVMNANRGKQDLAGFPLHDLSSNQRSATAGNRGYNMAVN